VEVASLDKKEEPFDLLPGLLLGNDLPPVVLLVEALFQIHLPLLLIGISMY